MSGRTMRSLETPDTSTLRLTQLAWRGLGRHESTLSEAHRPYSEQAVFQGIRLKAPSGGDTTSIDLQGSVETVVAINTKSPVLS